ncbi:unnamed protein product [Paramecium octaurelia]|uniref:Uncharacterized protein n=1 Tax=Paramecium octaurelia TaxID=43137 RepID=A0A8S1YNH0_PAROT|nr:unnamed protein product [Paramecium octaurelia]
MLEILNIQTQVIAHSYLFQSQSSVGRFVSNRSLLTFLHTSPLSHSYSELLKFYHSLNLNSTGSTFSLLINSIQQSCTEKRRGDEYETNPGTKSSYKIYKMTHVEAIKIINNTHMIKKDGFLSQQSLYILFKIYDNLFIYDTLTKGKMKFKSGVQQGSQLNPFLYNRFFDHFYQYLEVWLTVEGNQKYQIEATKKITIQKQLNYVWFVVSHPLDFQLGCIPQFSYLDLEDVTRASEIISLTGYQGYYKMIAEKMGTTTDNWKPVYLGKTTLSRRILKRAQQQNPLVML